MLILEKQTQWLEGKIYCCQTKACSNARSQNKMNWFIINTIWNVNGEFKAPAIYTTFTLIH